MAQIQRFEKPVLCFIDAPLTLPLCYQQVIPDPDFHYRKADRQTGAMSPLFLGGLTARAMHLKFQLSRHQVDCFETYPGQFMRHYFPDLKSYKKDSAAIETACQKLFNYLPKAISTFPSPQNWHQFDALVALVSAFRFLHQSHITYGNSNEGLIII